VKRLWLIAQRWDRLLFAHWRAEPAAVAKLLPRGLEPDLFDGSAWVAVVAFVMRGTRTLGALGVRLPPIPELNVRTYVRVDGAPAVWFLSLDASSPLFVGVGRALYGMDYRLSHMTAIVDGDRIHYASTRAGAAFAASYGPCGEPRRVRRGSLEHFLVERYRLFALRRGRLITAEVAHEPWPLQPAVARIELNRMEPPGIVFADAPLLHFCRGVDALVSAPLPAAAASTTLWRGSREERRFATCTSPSFAEPPVARASSASLS
jgi:uncharacterized protein YqjF (DUF2071 family)